MKTIYVVISDSLTGLGKIGTIFVAGDDVILQGDLQPVVSKSPGESANPHHPESAAFNSKKMPILLTVLEGMHKIFVANDGYNEVSVELGPNDQIIFCDFEETEVSNNSSLQFNYTGHRSQAGPSGAKIQARVLNEHLKLGDPRLHFKERL